MQRSDNQCRRFCAVLLGPPLCALSTHYALAAASFNLGICTSLPHDAYALTELLLHRIVFFCHTHSTHRCSTLINCAFKSYPTMQLPSTSWSCNISQSTLWDMFCCFWQNRLSLRTAQSITTSTVLAHGIPRAQEKVSNLRPINRGGLDHTVEVKHTCEHRPNQRLSVKIVLQIFLRANLSLNNLKNRVAHKKKTNHSASWESQIVPSLFVLSLDLQPWLSCRPEVPNQN